MPSHPSANASEIEAAAQWLGPVDPFVASSLPIRIDPVFPFALPGGPKRG